MWQVFFVNYILSLSGAGIFVEGGVNRVLANNSLITTNRIVPTFRCLSGSSVSSVGNLIGPLGNDITLSPSDPFLVSRGSSYDPGTLLVRSVRPLQMSGIYTYRTPDEDGEIVDFHFGLYLSNSSGTVQERTFCKRDSLSTFWTICLSHSL